MKALPLSKAVRSLPPQTEAFIVTPAGIVQNIFIHSIRTDRDFLIISFDGITSREEASMLRNAIIEVDASVLPELGENEYYYHQIVGLSVVTADGKIIGTITEIMETLSHEVYVVQGGSREYLIPAVASVIADINLKAGTMTITPIDGLLD